MQKKKKKQPTLLVYRVLNNKSGDQNTVCKMSPRHSLILSVTECILSEDFILLAFGLSCQHT